jgi:hypothetical protein
MPPLRTVGLSGVPTGGGVSSARVCPPRRSPGKTYRTPNAPERGRCSSLSRPPPVRGLSPISPRFPALWPTWP